MGIGYLTIAAEAGENALPVSNALIKITDKRGNLLYQAYTDASGNTDTFSLQAPPASLTLDKNYTKPAYAVYDVTILKPGFVEKHIHDVQIIDGETSILPVNMLPLSVDHTGFDEEDIYIPEVGLLIPTDQQQQVGTNTNPLVLNEVIIPDYITVHLGAPTNTAARNVRVKFTDYIKNVASSEIYPTWPHNSLVANIHVITTFALNRVFTEWYRGRGFNFDITNSTAYDQYFVEGRNIYQSISNIVDGIFNVYARRFGFRNPFFTQFCNGTTVTCRGLSQWGTVDLANRGYTPIQILHYYYPDDLELVSSNNIRGIASSYPGYSLSVGSSGAPVQQMQNFLNRIRVNYPLIPLISNPNGVFGADTQNAVRTFQRTFKLTADGVIGQVTWNKISQIYVGVIKLGELDSEGIRAGIGMNPPTSTLREGSRGEDVVQLQFILNAISSFYPSISMVIQDGVFGTTTSNAVKEFQRTFNLIADGVVGRSTWNSLYAVYRGIAQNAPVPPAPEVPAQNAPPYPGTSLRRGSTGPNVRLMQTYLNTIRRVYPSINPLLVVDGVFGEGTEKAVISFQQQFILTPDGIIGPQTWNKIVQQFLLATGQTSPSLAFPGNPLRLGDRGSNVTLMQTFLSDLARVHADLISLTPDGIFGPMTQQAVIAFQNKYGLTPDGIIGPQTWAAIVNQRNLI